VLTVKPGQTIAFTYARRTKSGHAGRIGTVESVNLHANTVTICESVNGQEQYRQFHASAMLGVVVGN